LAITDDEVDLTVGFLERTIGVAPFGRWRWSPFLSVIVMAIVVVLATSIVVSIISSIVALVVVAIITTISPVVITPVVVVIAMIVIAPIIAAAVAVIITSIPAIVARIGPAIAVISSIRSTGTVVETLATILVVVVAAPSLLGGRRDP
jgi:hypothetical protein